MSLHPHTNFSIPPSAILSPKEMAILSVLQNERFLKRSGMTQQDIRHRLLFMPWKQYKPIFGRKVPSLGCIHRGLRNLQTCGYAIEVSHGTWKAATRA